jgi:hypothetical protein
VNATRFQKESKTVMGHIKTRVWGNFTMMISKDKRNINMLMNIYHPPGEGNFCDEHENTLKPARVQDYDRHMG